MTDPITKAIIRLFDSERFYAELILKMDRYINRNIPTACVCVKENIELHINPDFFNSKTKDEQVAILKHECQHILNDHISRAKELAPEVYAKGDHIDGMINQAKHMLINISADLAINPGIQHILKDAQMPERYKLPNGQTMEYYVSALKDNKEFKQLNSFDDHSLWSESDSDKDALKEKIKQAVNDAAAKTKAAGVMTSDVELLVDRLMYTPKDWKKDLSRFASSALSVLLESTKKKRNRRYGIMYPGFVKKEELHIGVAIDTSGSISDEALGQFMAEIANIAKYATVTVVEADSEVKNSYLFDPKKKYKVSGRGGTAYQPAFDYFTNETDVDGVIYLGDMDTFGEKLTKPKYPVMWAVIGDQAPPADWGSKTKVEVKLK